MSPLSPYNGATLTVARDHKTAGSTTSNNGWLGHGARATRTRTNGNFFAIANGANNHILIIDFGKPAVADIRSRGDCRQDATDMARLCDGDDEAIARLMDRHTSRLQMTVAKMLRDRTEAADVVEEAFIRVYQHRQRFDLRANFTTWLYTIALNRARDRLRSRARKPELVSLEDLSEEELESQQRVLHREQPPDARLESKEFTDALAVSLAALPPQLREPLELFACKDCPQTEIAKRFACSVKAIEGRLFQARKRLRTEVGRFLSLRPTCLSVSSFKHQHEINIKT